MQAQAHLFEAPPGAVERHRTRWYQDEAIAALDHGWDRHRSQLLVMATGSGKSVVVSTVASHTRGRVLALANRDELVQQMAEHMQRATGEYVEIEQGLNRAYRARIVVASVQSITQERRLRRFDPKAFELVVADEAHLFMAPTYRRVLEYFEAKRLGVTATPDRGDKLSLGALFDRVAYTYDIEDGINDGYLVPLLGERVHLNSVDLTNVKKTGGDFQAGELDEMMVKSVEGIVHEVLRLHPDRKGITFLPGIKSAELYQQVWNRYRPDECAFISGHTDPDERRQIVADFRANRYRHLANCQIATLGFDVPDIDLVVQGRPTLSRTFYAQTVGRGTRVLPGVVDGTIGRERADERQRLIAESDKPNCVVMDFVGNSGKHSLMCLADALGGKYSDAEIKAAKKKEKGGAIDGLAALRQARAELKALAEATRAKVSAEVSQFNPFVVYGLEPTAPSAGDAPATAGQLDVLARAGIAPKELEDISCGQASRLIKVVTERRRKQLCTFKQLSYLKMHGVESSNIAFVNASKALDYLFGELRAKRTPDRAVLGYLAATGKRAP
jgi:superfamily II DNA or RNA helicase